MEWTDVETKERLLLDDEPSVTSAADESSQQSSGGGGAPPNALCYCERERDVRQVELQCCRCLKWFHKQCVTSAVGRCLPFMTCYTFWCRDCGADSVEAFSRRQTNFSQMCETAIANLMVGAEDDGNRVSFSKDREIIPFIDANWEVLTTMPRRIKHTWHQTVVKTMTKETDTFIHDARDPNDPHFALRNQDLLRIGPNYDSARIDPTGGVPNRFGGRGAKRRFEPSEALAAKRQKSELSSPKLPPNGFPAEFPFNKDGYRYVLAEPDPHGPFRQEFEESQDLAGKPIPGWLCRKLMPDWVALSLHDRATQLKVSDSDAEVDEL
jgi:Set1/Ash2 histone methyltransferase complex subunit ASH2